MYLRASDWQDPFVHYSNYVSTIMEIILSPVYCAIESNPSIRLRLDGSIPVIWRGI